MTDAARSHAATFLRRWGPGLSKLSLCRTALGVSRLWPLNVPMSEISFDQPFTATRQTTAPGRKQPLRSPEFNY